MLTFEFRKCGYNLDFTNICDLARPIQSSKCETPLFNQHYLSFPLKLQYPHTVSNMARGRPIVVDSSDDEFPDLQDIVAFKAKASSKNASSTQVTKTDQPAPKNIVRRRKLGASADNPLLRPLGDSDRSSSTPAPSKGTQPKKQSTTPQRIELRTRKTKPAVNSVEVDEDLSEAGSIQEETIIEDFSEDDIGSDFDGSESVLSESEDSTFSDFLQRSPSKSKRAGDGSRNRKSSPTPSAQLLAEAIEAEERDGANKGGGSRDKRKYTRKADGPSQPRSSADLVDPLRRLQVSRPELPPPRSRSPEEDVLRPATPTSPPARPELKYKGLVSPSKKIPRIPATPHHAQTDTFWNQEFIDEWNDEHSPKKQLFLPSAATKSPYKKPGSQAKAPSQAAVQKAAKKAFSQSKHEAADKFLQELDERVTEGKLSELSAGTGGIRVEWTNKLNTTAGRANWKRETIKTKAPGKEGETVSVRYRHHASIELSTKVIDDSHRLLNVIAHEFCHLANFMISGVTSNPHGREFKGWAAQVTRAFGESRGIEVTTKHSYDIDFKYVWECTACGIEFKRHSKSIDPERHRCGACKSELRQTKPVPRARPGNESEYQRFMKEQMKVIKEENPGSPQKDIMKMVASRWKSKEAGDGTSSSASSSQVGGSRDNKVDGVTTSLKHLTIVDLT